MRSEVMVRLVMVARMGVVDSLSLESDSGDITLSKDKPGVFMCSQMYSSCFITFTASQI
jgi:hypothetical protein